MVTLDGLVARVQRQLQGYALTQEQVTALAQEMPADATSFSVDAADLQSISRGVVEIDDELVLVRSYDQGSGLVQVMGGGRGRGYRGTAPASHEAGSLVTTAPAFPRQAVKDAIGECISSLYPDLVAFGSTEITRISVVYEYEMPADAEDVWYVTGETIGPTRIWQPLSNWRFNPSVVSDAFASGKSIQLLDEIVPGRRYRVVYAKRPQALLSGPTDFTATGYPESVSEVVQWGACARLVPSYEAGRLQQRAVESIERGQIVPPQTALRTAAYYQGLYEQSLGRERRRMFQEMPTYSSYQGT